MAKVKPILWKSKKNAGGLCPIYLRIADTNKSRYLSIREYVRESQWNEKRGEVRGGHRDAERINTIIKSRIAAIQNHIYALKHEEKAITATRLKEGFEGGSGKEGDFCTFAREIISGYDKRGQIASHVRLTAIVNKLESYHLATQDSKELLFSEITSGYLRLYEGYLASHYGNATNTIAKDLAGIRTIIYTAIRENVIEQNDNPFFSFKIKQKPVSKARLTIDEIEKIEALDLPHRSRLWHTRNAFLFSLWMGGIRFGDIGRLRWQDVAAENGRSRLRYVMQKTKQPVNLLVSQDAEVILNKYRENRGRTEYVFPILEGRKLDSERDKIRAKASENTIANKNLAEIQVLAGIDTKISFHVSRHSFAELARRRGWDLSKISKALRHASLKQTQAYLNSLGDEELDDDLDSLRGDR